LKEKRAGMDVALLVGDRFGVTEVAPWTRLPRFTLKEYAGDLSEMPNDLPQRLERAGRE
jgi:hypothetical protein